MVNILEGITVNGKPLREHVKEAPVPEIKEVMKAAINIYRCHSFKERYKTKVERAGKCHHFTREEILRVMDEKMPLVDTILSMLIGGEISTELVHNAYKQYHPEATVKNTLQAVSRVCGRLGDTIVNKRREGKKIVYSLKEDYSVADLKNLYHSGIAPTKKELNIDNDQRDCAEILKSMANDVLNGRLEVKHLETSFDQATDTKELTITFTNRR